MCRSKLNQYVVAKLSLSWQLKMLAISGIFLPMSSPFREIPPSNLFVFELALRSLPLATTSTHRGLTCLGILMVGWFGLQDDPVPSSTTTTTVCLETTIWRQTQKGGLAQQGRYDDKYDDDDCVDFRIRPPRPFPSRRRSRKLRWEAWFLAGNRSGDNSTVLCSKSITVTMWYLRQGHNLHGRPIPWYLNK